MHARRALAAAEDPLDLLDRANSIGTSVELLAKSALAHISPTLIAEKDPKSALLLSGLSVVAAYEAKTKSVTDCLMMLKSMGVDFNQQRDINVLAVRNFALHLGQVDRSLFDEALGTMASLCEELLRLIVQHDGSLDRAAFWGSDVLKHVDERLKEEQEAKTLRLQELLAAARRAFERLESLGLDEGALKQLAERNPEIDDEDVTRILDWSPNRRDCPACGQLGWLGYQVIDRSAVYVETDGMCDAYHLVEVRVEATQFVCAVCGLDLDSELLSLEGLDDVQQITDQASDEEIEAREQYDIDRYFDDY